MIQTINYYEVILPPHSSPLPFLLVVLPKSNIYFVALKTLFVKCLEFVYIRYDLFLSEALTPTSRPLIGPDTVGTSFPLVEMLEHISWTRRAPSARKVSGARTCVI